MFTGSTNDGLPLQVILPLDEVMFKQSIAISLFLIAFLANNGESGKFEIDHFEAAVIKPHVGEKWIKLQMKGVKKTF